MAEGEVVIVKLESEIKRKRVGRRLGRGSCSSKLESEKANLVQACFPARPKFGAEFGSNEVYSKFT